MYNIQHQKTNASNYKQFKHTHTQKNKNFPKILLLIILKMECYLVCNCVYNRLYTFCNVFFFYGHTAGSQTIVPPAVRPAVRKSLQGISLQGLQFVFFQTKVPIGISLLLALPLEVVQFGSQQYGDKKNVVIYLFKISCDYFLEFNSTLYQSGISYFLN